MFKIKNIIIFLMFLVVSLINVPQGLAAVGCTLNDPDRDIIRIFPGSTGYKTEFITIEERGGEALMAQVEARLEDQLDDVFETSDVPYAYYTVLNKKEVIGYVHGVNQKGMYGGMQLILATDLDGVIIDFYYQKISSPEAKQFKADEFTGQFAGLTLKDFSGRSIDAIGDPSDNSREDYLNTMRGLKKNLILLDIFKLNHKHSASNKE